MFKVRVIPCLDVKDGRVVNGVNFVDLRDAGDPVEAAIAYDAQGADELVFLDITASHEARDIMLDVVKRTAEGIYMPLTVGGGIRSVDDVRRLLRAGADKVSLNTAALDRPEAIREAVERFGSHCIVVAIDARREPTRPGEPTRWGVYTHGGRRPAGRGAIGVARGRGAARAGGLIPAVVQEVVTGEILMVAWMDRPAVEASQASGLSHFWSRSRGKPWRKGETSGHVQHVQSVFADCDADVLLVQVHQEGVACHTGNRTCFFTAIKAGPPGATMIERLERIVASRKTGAPAGSYVAGLLARGEPAIARKIGEEATEVITAALGGEGDRRVVEEVADLWFHTIVLLGARGIAVHDVLEELARRHQARATPGA